jgi:hypothetical protein
MESSHSKSESVAKKLLAKQLGEVATGRFAGLAPEKVTIAQLAELVIQFKTTRARRSAASKRSTTGRTST